MSGIPQKIAALTLIIVTFCGLSAPLCASQLPDLGNEFRSVLSVHNEKILGDHLMRELRAAGLLYPDQIVHEYLRYIGNRLTPHMPVPYANLHPKFFVVNDKTVNAFAFFGAHLCVHSGLITMVNTENELAGVMAHELGHISQQHLIRQMAESKRTMPLAIAGSIAASILAGPELALPVLSMGMQHMINFSRQHEQEADRVGMQILANAKFDPQGLPSVLERMNTNYRYEGKMPEYLSTHPLFESRIADTRHRASKLPYTPKADSQMFHLIKARVLVQNADNMQQLLYELKQQLQSARYPNELGTKYTYAYALHKLGKNKEALAAIQSVLALAPNNLIVQMTAAEIETDNNNFKQAQMRLEDQLALQSDSQALQLQYIDLLLMTSQAPQALRTLDQYQKQHPTDLMYYELRRQVMGMLDNKIGVYEANAEWYFLNGAYESALTQLGYAIDQPDMTPAIKARIEQRSAEIQNLMKTLKSL